MYNQVCCVVALIACAILHKQNQNIIKVSGHVVILLVQYCTSNQGHRGCLNLNYVDMWWLAVDFACAILHKQLRPCWESMKLAEVAIIKYALVLALIACAILHKLSV